MDDRIIPVVQLRKIKRVILTCRFIPPEPYLRIVPDFSGIPRARSCFRPSSTSSWLKRDFQLTEDAQGERLFEKVLKTSQQWGNDENMMYVVGATQGKMFEDIRKVAPNHFLLVPGVGAQGGSLEEVCKYGMTKDCGLLVNSSRGIIYASNGEDFAEVAAQKAQELQQQMAEELKKVGL